MRIKPYPPSFNKTAARIMEPATGASTCAFGSQRCVPYMGNFTKKASRNPAHHNLSPHVAMVRGVE